MINLNNSKILVTGGCGFIGSNFIEYVNNAYENLSIVNVDKMGVGSRSLFGNPYLERHHAFNYKNKNSYDFYKIDIRNEFPLWWNKATKFDCVFHFAAESHVDRSINSPISFIENNVLGIVRLLDWVRENSPGARVVSVSTDECYGHLNKYDRPFTEKSPLNPRSPYSASKASADLIAKAYAETFGLDIITTRCCNNYGPHQHDEKFIPTIVRSLMQGKKIPVYGNGENRREWIYVEDHNKSLLEIAEVGKSGEVYNIPSIPELEMSNLELIEEIIKIVDPDSYYGNWKKYIEFVEDRKGHDFRYALDSYNYDRNFELRDFYEAMEETVNFYVKKYE